VLVDQAAGDGAGRVTAVVRLRLRLGWWRLAGHARAAGDVGGAAAAPFGAQRIRLERLIVAPHFRLAARIDSATIRANVSASSRSGSSRNFASDRRRAAR